MLKIEDRTRKTPKQVDAFDIPIRTVFCGRVGSEAEEGVYLRAYELVVSLTDASMTWGVEGRGLVVSDYLPLKATLILEDAEQTR